MPLHVRTCVFVCAEENENVNKGMEIDGEGTGDFVEEGAGRAGADWGQWKCKVTWRELEEVGRRRTTRMCIVNEMKEMKEEKG
jgi:hypothetical protein